MSLQAFDSAVSLLKPMIGLTLGSGLGDVPYGFQADETIPFADLPGVSAAGVHGHKGVLSVGRCAGVPLIVCRGRLHYYEGHSWERVGRLMEIQAGMGIRLVILTNAAGGIHPELSPGSLMVIRGILDWQHPRDRRRKRCKNPAAGSDACTCSATVRRRGKDERRR